MAFLYFREKVLDPAIETGIFTLIIGNPPYGFKSAIALISNQSKLAKGKVVCIQTISLNTL